MSKPVIEKVAEHYLRNQEKWMTIIERLVEADEEIESYTSCLTKLPYVSWIPFLDYFRKRYVLVLTNRRLIIIRSKLIKVEYVSHESTPLEHVRVPSARSGIWGGKLLVRTPNRRYRFVECSVVDFPRGLKEAVDDFAKVAVQKK